MLWILLAVVIAVIALAVIKKRAETDAPVTGATWSYQRKDLLSRSEQIVYNALRSAVPELVVLTQVAVSQMVTTKGREHWKGRNLVNRLVADFVVCDRAFKVIAVIELDGRSHDNPRQQKRDGKKNSALDAAGYTVIRWNSADIPTKDAMRQQLLPSAPVLPGPVAR